ncbi:NAD-dependent epimerase/dehydratase family protein [Gymnodinialimonas hymeniacidonis]|uniref:NAD-dependent epimerase/dehydratase family protein n=1 Tax=Gymnodinialimonas hymeniacidonis TaxID=3126508 RepID=UPI0034C6B7AB
MTILITGATGFFGQAILRQLPTSSGPVRCVIRTGTKKRLGPHEHDVEVVEVDDLFAQTAAWWADILSGVDTVIHAAWYAEPGKYLTSHRNLSCLTGTLALAEGAFSAQVSRFVGIGTCFEYDFRHGYLSVDTPCGPETLYAAAKASAFLTLSNLFRGTDTAFLWARLFFLFGAGEHPDRLVPYLHRTLSAGEAAELSSGQQVRDYMDVDAAASLLVQDVRDNVVGPTNICSGKAQTVAEIATEIAESYGRKDLLVFGARPDNLVDPPVIVGVRP